MSNRPESYLIIAPTSLPETTRAVVLKSDPAGYGLKFGGAMTASNGKEKGWGILIIDKKPGTPSASCDDIVIGWQLIRLNGVDLSQAMFGDLKNALQQVTDDQMELELTLNLGLAKAYDVAIGVAPSDARAAAAAAAAAASTEEEALEVPAAANAPSDRGIERKETDWGDHPPGGELVGLTVGLTDASADNDDADAYVDETEVDVVEELVRRMTAVSMSLARFSEGGGDRCTDGPQRGRTYQSAPFRETGDLPLEKAPFRPCGQQPGVPKQEGRRGQGWHPARDCQGHPLRHPRGEWPASVLLRHRDPWPVSALHTDRSPMADRVGCIGYVLRRCDWD